MFMSKEKDNKNITRRSDYDKKGRKLYKGESQREDGRYEFRYTDANGKRKSFYSWKLNPNDPIPQGKKSGPSLREKEHQIERDKHDGITASNITVDDLWKKFIATKTELKDSTRNGYIYTYNKYVKPVFGDVKISEVKYSNILAFYNQLLSDVGMDIRTLQVVQNILHPMFDIAVKDECIRTNPTTDAIKKLKSSNKTEKKKIHALTQEQQNIFFEYVSDSDTYNHWLDLFVVLLGTGCRIGELLGLTWKDINFDAGIININHSISYRPQEDGKCKHRISTPKTKQGTRDIPMIAEVKEALLRIKEEQRKNGKCKSVVDGYFGFVFINRDRNVMMFSSVNKAIDRITKEYNKKVQEDLTIKNPVILPHFTAHCLRHTFCTRLFEKTTDFKAVQELMGHADIETTMNVYDEVFPDRKNKAITTLDGMITINKKIKNNESEEF